MEGHAGAGGLNPTDVADGSPERVGRSPSRDQFH
jgi:hypothetical protein